jgi:hypothetical protein
MSMALTARRYAVKAGLVLVMIMAACSSTDAAGSRASGTTSTTLGPAAFADAVRANDLEALTATFAEDIELYSPVLAEPFVGRERVSRLFGVLIETFDDIRITHELDSTGTFVLSFHARVGAEPIQIVDLLDFDESGHIETFTVTARPLAGVNALAAAVAPRLAEIG